MREYLINAMGFPEGNILYITDEEAGKAKFEYFFGTKDNYKGRLYNLIKRAFQMYSFSILARRTRSEQQRSLLVPADGDVEAISLPLQLDDFLSNLDKLPAKNVVVALDCCFSAARIREHADAEGQSDHGQASPPDLRARRSVHQRRRGTNQFLVPRHASRFVHLFLFKRFARQGIVTATEKSASAK
jgi:hypothetical protein